MSMLGFFLHTSIHNLRRGGQRVLVAFLCITFGVMSLVAMMMLSQSIASMLVAAPQHLIGADISMIRKEEDFVLPEHIQELKALQQSGMIQRFSLVAYTSSLTFRTPGSGEMHFLSAGIGIDPTQYPLIGTLNVSQPGNTGLSTLLQGAGDIVVTRDVAIESHLKVGDTIILSDLHTGAPVTCRIRGIASDTPNHQGSKIYYNHETAALIAGDPIAGNPSAGDLIAVDPSAGGARMINTVLATAADPVSVKTALVKSGWIASLAIEQADNEKMVQQMFEMMLNGAGILGLLVGGIGIANTMQVLLQRRRKEVAVWKTLGYRPGQMQLLFALEAALLGAAGSLTGAALGVGVSWVLVDLFSRITTLLITWTLSPLTAITGFLVGLVTAVTFAMFAIVITSQVKPLALLRGEALNASGTAGRAFSPLNAARLPWLQSAGLAALLAVPLTAVTSLVMGSLLAGIGVLLVALFGLIGLGGLMAGLKWLITRLLPLRWLPLANLARSSLRRGFTLVFAMVALFVGVVSLSLGTVVTQNAGRVMDERTIQVGGDNITILAPAGQEQAIRQAVANQTVEHSSFGYQSTVRSIHVVVSGGVPASEADSAAGRGGVPAQSNTSITPVLIGRSEPSDYTLKGAAWGSVPDGVYTFQLSQIPAGSQVEVTLWDGTVRAFPVVGSYFIDFQGYRPQPGLGLLMPVSLFQKAAPAETVQFFAKAPAGQVQRISASLGSSLPEATVINLLAYAARFTQSYQNLFVFAVAMAGLALLAGVLLVANSVSLAMLDRRYEIGVLKAMGYARRHILTTLVVEYSLVALTASASGLSAVAVFLWLVGIINRLAGSLLVMPLPTALIIGAASTGLALLTVLLTTWGPVQVSPAIVLNDRE